MILCDSSLLDAHPARRHASPYNRAPESTERNTMNGLSEAVVLAGGEGTRLRPLTRNRPKPMLPVANRPVVEYVLDALAHADVERAVVVVGHRGDRIRDHLGETYRGLELAYVHQKAQLGSGHALQQARGTVDSPFLVVNGDNVVDAGMICGTVEHFLGSDAAACVAVAPSDTPEEYGAVLTVNGTVETIIEHPADAAGYRINAGVYAFTDDIFEALERTDTRAGELYVTDALVDLPGEVLAADVSGVWLDPSYPWDLLSITEQMLSSHRELIADPATFADGVLIDEAATVHDSAVVEAPAVVGPDCEVGTGAVVRANTCLGQNAAVGPYSVVERSIVGPDARVGANAVLRDCLIGSGARLDDGVVAPGGPADVAVNDRVFRGKRLGAVVGDRATVGANATLEPGVMVGPGSSVGPGVTAGGEIPEDTEVVH